MSITLHIGMPINEEIVTDDEAYASYVVAHYRKQGISVLMDDGKDDCADFETIDTCGSIL